MDDANGALRVPMAPSAINGAVKAPLNQNGHTVAPQPRARPRRPGLLARTLSAVARLLTWYSIFTLLFRCPATLDACDATSPRICKPYFQLKRAVAPHIEPYYDNYAAPYVELVRPYYNTVDRRIIAPSWGYAKQYGAPRLQQAQAFGKARWEQRVQPRVAEYRDFARARYDQKLAPHINRVSAAFGPYCEIVRTNSLQTYHGLLVPAYQHIQPHLWRGYRATSAFTSNTVVPAFVWTWNKTYAFLDGTVGPQIRAIYVENVEPQLVKIGKRLGRYSTSKKSVPKLHTDSPTSSSTKTTSSFTRPAVSVPVTSTSTLSTATPPASAAQGENPAAGSSRTRATMEPVPPPEIDEDLEEEDPARREAREIVAADLKDWQERYAKAADEGAAEIEARVHEIAKKMIRRNAKVTGKSLLERLQTTAVSELVGLRRAIVNVVGAVKKGAATAEEGQEQVAKAVRKAGLAVKEKAQDVRTWRENYEAEMQTAITKAAEAHFAILENIRDLALQKIGMKWAWTDGITYKDWAKYHLLKSRFEEWKGELENLVVTHPSLEAAQIEGADIEDEAMKVAASTAKELARLKQVAGWKLIAGDDTPEFDSTLMQQAAEAAESVKDAKDAAVEGVDEGVSRVSEAVEKATAAVVGARDTTDQAGQVGDSGGSPAKQSQSSDASHAAEEAAEATIEASATEAVAAASEELSGVVEPISEASHDTEPEIPTSDHTASLNTADVPVMASSVIFETPVMVGNVTEPVNDNAPGPADLPVEEPENADPEHPSGEPPASDPTSAVKPAFLGAAAQSVPSRRPILDDDTVDDIFSEYNKLKSAYNEWNSVYNELNSAYSSAYNELMPACSSACNELNSAYSSAYNELNSAYSQAYNELNSAYSSAMSRAGGQFSQALSVVSTQIRGTTKPAHQRLLASVTSAYSRAMAWASSRLGDGLKLASDQLHGTTTTKAPPPTAVPMPQVPGVDWSGVESIAAERLQQGRAWAEEQYESAKIAVGLATPTASTPAEHVSKLLDNAKHNYYAGLGLAHARYSEFLSAASSALSSMTATPTPTGFAGSASSIASVASGSAASAASAGYDRAAAAGERVAEGWDVVITKISIQVYGAPTPTPWYSSAYSAAAEYAASATALAGEGAASATSSIVSELLVGKEPSFSESVISRFHAAYATGASSALSLLAGAARETAASAAGDASDAVEDTVLSHDRDEL